MIGFSFSKIPSYIALPTYFKEARKGCSSVCETMEDYKEGYLMVWTNYMSPCSHTAVKRGARAQFPPKLSLNKVLNFPKFSLSSPKLRQSLKS